MKVIERWYVTKVKRIGMVFLGPFPIGNVSTLRINSYCKALVDKGYYVKVYILAPTTEAKINKERLGVDDGIEYEYLTKITWQKENTSFFIKINYYLFGILKMCRYIFKDKIDILMTYHSEIVFNCFMAVFSKIKNIPFVLDKTEYPKKKYSILEKLKLKFFDGIITISKELEVYYKTHNKSIFLLPMSINPKRYQGLHETKITDNITVVFGVHNRDCIEDSILGFIKFLKDTGNISSKLILVGDYKRLFEMHDLESLNKTIKDSGFEHRIVFKGLVPIDEIPYILKSSRVLLSTPLFFISGGFPTKLGEYLLSGVPVVATRVGELEDYLCDKKDIIFVEPNNIDSIAKNLDWVFKNEHESKKIGLSGAEKANRVFNAGTYVDDLVLFLESL
jgi:glycosyltransferase involved in cell wall biosynthesis